MKEIKIDLIADMEHIVNGIDETDKENHQITIDYKLNNLRTYDNIFDVALVEGTTTYVLCSKNEYVSIYNIDKDSRHVVDRVIIDLSKIKDKLNNTSIAWFDSEEFIIKYTYSNNKVVKIPAIFKYNIMVYKKNEEKFNADVFIKNLFESKESVSEDVKVESVNGDINNKTLDDIRIERLIKEVKLMNTEQVIRVVNFCKDVDENLKINKNEYDDNFSDGFEMGKGASEIVKFYIRYYPNKNYMKISVNDYGDSHTVEIYNF
jgi:hypothetical protein